MLIFVVVSSLTSTQILVNTSGGPSQGFRRNPEAYASFVCCNLSVFQIERQKKAGTACSRLLTFSELYSQKQKDLEKICYIEQSDK